MGETPELQGGPEIQQESSETNEFGIDQSKVDKAHAVLDQNILGDNQYVKEQALETKNKLHDLENEIESIEDIEDIAAFDKALDEVLAQHERAQEHKIEVELYNVLQMGEKKINSSDIAIKPIVTAIMDQEPLDMNEANEIAAEVIDNWQQAKPYYQKLVKLMEKNHAYIVHGELEDNVVQLITQNSYPLHSDKLDNFYSNSATIIIDTKLEHDKQVMLSKAESEKPNQEPGAKKPQEGTVDEVTVTVKAPTIESAKYEAMDRIQLGEIQWSEPFFEAGQKYMINSEAVNRENYANADVTRIEKVEDDGRVMEQYFVFFEDEWHALTDARDITPLEGDTEFEGIVVKPREGSEEIFGDAEAKINSGDIQWSETYEGERANFKFNFDLDQRRAEENGEFFDGDIAKKIMNFEDGTTETMYYVRFDNDWHELDIEDNDDETMVAQNGE